jgi:hypothetical protein
MPELPQEIARVMIGSVSIGLVSSCWWKRLARNDV